MGAWKKIDRSGLLLKYKLKNKKLNDYQITALTKTLLAPKYIHTTVLKLTSEKWGDTIPTGYKYVFTIYTKFILSKNKGNRF